MVVVGVAGASCSGKSTLCQMLCKLYNCKIISQDAFYKHDSLIPIDSCSGLQNWDSPEALDMDSFINTLKNIKDNDIVLVDGFLLYHDPRILEQLDICVFLTASYDTLHSRRLSRTGYNTLEGYWSDPPNYFENIVWPMYLKYNQPIPKDDSCHSDKQFLIIDSDTHSISDMVKIVSEFITTKSKNL